MERNLLSEAKKRHVFRAAFDIASEILAVDPEGAIDLSRRLTEYAYSFAAERATALMRAAEDHQPAPAPTEPP
jgi:hypothetical protein